MAIPSFRDRIPVILDEVTTICAPGELVDVIVTERGIAINPRREDLLKAVEGKGLPIRKIEEIRDEVYQIVGGPPQKPVLDRDKVVAIVNWVDGTVLDSVFKVVG